MCSNCGVLVSWPSLASTALNHNDLFTIPLVRHFESHYYSCYIDILGA